MTSRRKKRIDRRCRKGKGNKNSNVRNEIASLQLKYTFATEDVFLGPREGAQKSGTRKMGELQLRILAGMIGGGVHSMGAANRSGYAQLVVPAEMKYRLVAGGPRGTGGTRSKAASIWDEKHGDLLSRKRVGEKDR